MVGLVAVVVLEVVHAPLRECLGVVELVLEAAGVSAAGVGTRAGVHTELQTLAVNVFSHGLYAVRELPVVGNQLSVLVALLLAPAVVDDNVLVACVFQTLAYECVSGFPDELVVDFPGECVP